MAPRSRGEGRRLEHGDGWVDATFEATNFPAGAYWREVAEAFLDYLGKKQPFSSNTFLLVVTDSVQPNESPVSTQRSSARE